VLANAATNTNTASTIVKRDASGNFAAGIISVTDEIISNTVTITPFTTAGIIHNDATGLLSSSLIVNADVDPAAAIVDTKLATISTAGKVANSATTGTNLNTANTLVLRDALGNFNANNIIASLTGAASLNVLKAGDIMTGALQLPAGTNANPSLVFTGSTTSGLSANTGTLSFNTSGVERLRVSSGGAISINSFTTAGVVHNDASGNLSTSLIVNADIDPAAAIVDTKLATISTAGKVANSATTATAANTNNTIVLRDASGNFSANTITANLSGNATTATTATNATNAVNFTGSLSGDVTGTQSATVVSTVGGQTAANIAAATVLANAATNLNTANAIVKRDASGNFAAGTITANLSGNATTATTATNATNFTGSLSGDVTGTQSATVVSTVGGQTAANIASATTLANAATAANTASTIVKRTASGGFSAGTVSLTDEVISNTVTITPFTTAGIVHNDATGLLSSSLIVNADIDPAAAIADSKLATISTAGKVANSATTATSANTANTIVSRDASGNFNANVVIANLTGAASLNVLKSGDIMTGALQLPAGTSAAPSLIFTGSTTSGLSASAGNLSINTNGLERLRISSGGIVAIDGFTSAGIVHNDASGNLSSSLIVNSDIDPAAAIADSKLATISTAGKVANSATTATSANTANAIVSRDASGNFSAGTITANLIGNATTATSTTNFSGSLSGDVTGTQTATVVSAVGGQTAANVAAATTLANAATAANTASAIVRRSASGGFSAGAISVTDEVISNTLTITPFSTAGIVHNSATGLLSSSLIVNSDIDPAAAIADSKLATISTAGKVANSATTATNTSTANAIVSRDASGNFITNMITINGTPTNPTDVATKAYVDSSIAASGTSANTPNAVVRRDGTGSFAAQVISMTDGVLSGNLILSTDPSSSTAGIIMKDSNRFIHNFGTNNTFMGINAGNFTTSGTGNNTGIGTNALTANTTGIQNTAVGTNALNANTIGTDNVAIGSAALTASITASFNSAVGSGAMQNTTIGINNLAVGYHALFTNNIGAQNTAVGSNALVVNTTGANNTALGYNALPVVTTGSTNIAIGSGAGGTLTTGSGNIYINANAGSTTEANTIRIGTSQTTCYIQGIVGVNVGTSAAVRVNNATGQLGTINSSIRFKHDVKDMDDASKNVLDLRPVTFAYNDDPSEMIQYGLIAEEVNETFPNLVVRDRENLPLTVQYEVLPILLLNEMKKQQTTINDLANQVEAMNIAMNSLQAQIQEFMARVKNVEKQVITE
jgi:hypothetical protein